MKPFSLTVAVALLAGCTTNPGIVRISGAETRTQMDSPKVVPAGFSVEAAGTRMTLVTSEGKALVGLLSERRTPVAIRIAASDTPLVGGATELVGQIAGDSLAMECRFQLLNPVLGLTGGGTGTCQGSGRRVDFLY